MIKILFLSLFFPFTTHQANLPIQDRDNIQDTLAKTPPMGWMTWYTFNDQINQKLIMEVADSMVSKGFRQKGYTLIQLDDGWMAQERDSLGRQIADKLRFPDGIPFLAHYLHSRGFKLGIYSSDGTKTCAGYPGSFQHEPLDAETYASWGIDYLKYDACGEKEHHSDQELNQKMANALHATGRPILFESCVFYSHDAQTWARNISNMWRTGKDIVESIEKNPRVTYINWLENLNQVTGKESYAGPGHWNDPDNLIVGYPRNNGQSIEEEKAQFSFWSLISAPMMLCLDPRFLKPEERDIIFNEEAIRISQDGLGQQGIRIYKDEFKEIWYKNLKGGSIAVILFNKRDQVSQIQFSIPQIYALRKSKKAIAGSASKKFKVLDIWTGNQKTFIQSLYSAKVPPHGIRFLRIQSL